MKKTLSMILLVCVLALSVLTLASCGLSGEYVDEATSSTTLKFSGKNVTITTEVGAATLTYNAQYEITEEDDKKYITFSYEEGEEVNHLFNGKKSFSEGKVDGKAFIEIGISKFIKK